MKTIEELYKKSFEDFEQKPNKKTGQILIKDYQNQVS